MMKIKPGLGELLRYLAEMVDKGSQETYQNLNIDYRPRYTPILRALHAGAVTVQDVTALTRLTQGAISQSVSLMEQDGILTRKQQNDGRSFALVLTPAGTVLKESLLRHWDTIFTAIKQLEEDAGWPILNSLEGLAHCLEQQSFQERIANAHSETKVGGDKHE